VGGQWRYQRERVHIITRAVSVGERLPGGQLGEENHIWFADWFHQNITAGHPLELDLEWHLRLRLPLARTLALPLRLWLRASEARGHFEKRWDSLAEFLGLTCYPQGRREAGARARASALLTVPPMSKHSPLLLR